MRDLSHAVWRKSSRSGTGNNCVEVAEAPGVVGVRDSKNTGAGAIVLAGAQWRAFAELVKGGVYDL